MPYKEMSVSEGRKFLPKVWNMMFKPLGDENFFVPMWEGSEIRDCAEFRLDSGKDRVDEILFFVTDEELITFLQATTGELYVFGSYGQVNVCQVRTRGKVVHVKSNPDTFGMRERLSRTIEERVCASVHKLSQKEAEERFTILNNGQLFRFRVASYAYDTYERG